MQTPGQTVPPKPQAPAAQPPKVVPPPEFQSEKIDKLEQPDLIKILGDGRATVFQKTKACQRLATVGTRDAVPALAALLADPQIAHYARYGLEPLPDASADDALRGALSKTKGALLIGVINSIGHRKDSKAAAELSKLLHASDVEVARAAAAALGRISGPESAKSLEDGLGRTKGAVRTAIAGAGLVCAEELLARGDRAPALAFYTRLAATDIPKPVRLAAMHGIIAAETSLNRPR